MLGVSSSPACARSDAISIATGCKGFVTCGRSRGDPLQEPRGGLPVPALCGLDVAATSPGLRRDAPPATGPVCSAGPRPAPASPFRDLRTRSPCCCCGRDWQPARPAFLQPAQAPRLRRSRPCGLSSPSRARRRAPCRRRDRSACRRDRPPTRKRTRPGFLPIAFLFELWTTALPVEDEDRERAIAVIRHAQILVDQVDRAHDEVAVVHVRVRLRDPEPVGEVDRAHRVRAA